MLIIAHRLSTIQQADRVVVLKDWNIVEQGTYAGLMKETWALRALAHPEDIMI
jgi:ABC-type transport system involved in Fe-S cluster assembly fused permease/ATPase subunit